jgi:hypothetical protein
MKDLSTSDEILTRVRLQGGRYDGLYQGPEAAALEAVHEGAVIAVATTIADDAMPGRWRVSLELPATIISDGVQVIALRSTATGMVLDRVTLMAGAPLDDDIRAEVSLLRDELEMLKRAFRQHVRETDGS